MIAGLSLKLPWAVPLAAALLGLLLGLLGGLLPEGSVNRNLPDAWAPFPELKTGDNRSALEQLRASPQWENPPAEESTGEERLEVPGKPGVLAYLNLVAVVEEPQLAALLHVGRLPPSLQDELLLSPDGNGVITVQPGDMVSSGWSIVEISGTGVTLGQATASQEQAEEQNVVQYNLYEWNK